MLERFLLVWLVLLSLLAYAWNRVLPGAWDPFLASRSGLDCLFAVPMFAIGSMLPRDEARQALRSWPKVVGGTAVQYTVMPLLGYTMALAFRLDEAAAIGTILVGCVPGAMASNVITQVARGNVSYSVSLTTSATILSPLVVPWTLWLTLGRWIELPVGQITWQLSWTVVGPVILGYVLSGTLPRWAAAARRLGPVVANLTILWIIAVVVAINRQNLGAGVAPRLRGALAAVNLLGYLGGWLGARLLRLPWPMRRAFTLEVGMQNAGLGTVLAVNFFKDYPAATIPTALYTFGCVLTGTLLARFWAEYTDYWSRKATAGSSTSAESVGK